MIENTMSKKAEDLALLFNKFVSRLSADDYKALTMDFLTEWLVASSTQVFEGELHCKTSIGVLVWEVGARLSEESLAMIKEYLEEDESE